MLCKLQVKLAKEREAATEATCACGPPPASVTYDSDPSAFSMVISTTARPVPRQRPTDQGLIGAKL